MAYVKNTWATGDVVTAAKLNNIEDGIEEAAQSGGGTMFISTSIIGGKPTLSATFQEIQNAISAGAFPVLATTDNDYTDFVLLTSIYDSGSQFEVWFGESMFVAETKSDYPVLPESQGDQQT